METKEKRNSGLVVVIILLVISLLGSVGYIVYDKVLSKDKESADIEGKKDDKESKINEKDNSNQETSGKINVKRNGISKLEVVPNEIVGKYVNKSCKTDYFVLNEDGTAYISFPSGGDGIITFDTTETVFQLTYRQDNSDIVMLEFYYNSNVNDKSILSPIRKGNKISDKYVFEVTESTPTATPNDTETIFEKQ